MESEEEGFHVTRRIISSLNLSRRRREREEAVGEEEMWQRASNKGIVVGSAHSQVLTILSCLPLMYTIPIIIIN